MVKVYGKTPNGENDWVEFDEVEDAYSAMEYGELRCECGDEATHLTAMDDTTEDGWAQCENCAYETVCDGRAAAAYEEAAYGSDY